MSDKDTKKPNDTHTHLAPNNTNLTKNPLGTIIIAFSFSEIYLTYYLIYRVIMGNQCPA